MCTWLAGSRPLLPRGNLLSPLHLSWLQSATWKGVDLQEAGGWPQTQAHAPGLSEPSGLAGAMLRGR